MQAIKVLILKLLVIATVGVGCSKIEILYPENHEPDISLKSSSNFKAMDGIAFDMTCQINDGGDFSLDFYLPNGQRAKKNTFTELSHLTNLNAIKMKIKRGVKTKDEGLYKCVVSGVSSNSRNISRSVTASVSFVQKSFLNISTPNPIVKLNKEENSIHRIFLDFEALPYPKFAVLNDKFDREAFYEDSSEEEDSSNESELDLPSDGVIGILISPNRIQVATVDVNFLLENVTVIARNKDITANITIQFKVEGEQAPYDSIHSKLLSLFSIDIGKPELNVSFSQSEGIEGVNEWKPIKNTSKFIPYEYSKPDEYMWIDKSKKGSKLKINLHSVPAASVMSWVFQPCVVRCTPLERLVSFN